jgi:hypothetical protein
MIEAVAAAAAALGASEPHLKFSKRDALGRRVHPRLLRHCDGNAARGDVRGQLERAAATT